MKALDPRRTQANPASLVKTSAIRENARAVTPRTRYDVSPWAAGLPASARTAYPRLTQPAELPVVIVGGGLAGTAAAYAFAAAGVRVALVEAARLGSGGTGACAGHVLADPGGDFLDQELRLGRRAARAIWQSTRRASLELQAAVRRLKVRCGLLPLDAVTWARGSDEVKRLRREHQARQAAGLDASWLTGRAVARLGVDADAGLRTHGHAHLDPLRACLGFGRAAAARGAAIFERSPVTALEATTRGAKVVCGKTVLTAGTVVLATGEPVPPFGALERHFDSLDAYAVLTPPLAAGVRKAAADRGAVVQDRTAAAHRLTWLADDRILWTGADQPRTARTCAREGGPPADGPADVRTLARSRSHLRTAPCVRVERALQSRRGRAALRRSPPELPASPFRVGPRDECRVCLPREPHPPAALLGQADKDDEPFGFARFAR